LTRPVLTALTTTTRLTSLFVALSVISHSPSSQRPILLAPCRRSLTPKTLHPLQQAYISNPRKVDLPRASFGFTSPELFQSTAKEKDKLRKPLQFSNGVFACSIPYLVLKRIWLERRAAPAGKKS